MVGFSMGSLAGATSLVETSVGASSLADSSSVETSVGAGSSVGSSSVETLVGAGYSVGASSLAGAGSVFPRIVTQIWPSRDLSWGAAPSRTALSEKVTYGFTTLLNSITHLAKRCGWPGIGRLDFSTQYCKACAYAKVFWDCASLISWQ